MDTMTTNSELQQRKEKVFARGFGNIHQVYADRAENAEIWDVEGNRYIDFAGGIAVTGTGHCNPRITAAVKEQLDRFSHTCAMVNPYESMVRLAERLTELAPGAGPKKAAFVTTGAEAVENAVKIARAHTGRRGVISFNGSFHGRTMFALGLTGKIAPYKNLFGPFPGDIFHAPFPIEYHGISVGEAVAALTNIFAIDIAPTDVAAIIVEPVLGEGGYYPTPVTFLQALREICDEHGIVLIDDEIQAGIGRTGKMFCIEYADVEPDLITFAKGVAGGFPLAGVVGRAEVMDAPLPGGLGGTYAASPLGCVAALEVFDIIEEQNLLERSREIGDLFGRRLREMQEQHPEVIGDIRAERGAMIAVELVKNGDADQPDADLTKALLGAASKKGLLLLACGVRGNVIRFVPALTISDDMANEGLDIFGECLAELTS
jgi:4-aminobutyrate aminotransferase/(S)-3-amino-2-methylpropionate transaminase